MMNRTFEIISLHFADFVMDDWISWFMIKLRVLLPSLTAEMLQTVTSDTDCGAYHVMYVTPEHFHSPSFTDLSVKALGLLFQGL